MDPCPFVRIVIGNLALRVAESGGGDGGGGTGTGTGIVGTAGNFCQSRIKLKGFPTQVSALSVISSVDNSTTTTAAADPIESRVHACFSFRKLDFDKLLEKKKNCSGNNNNKVGCNLKIDVCKVKGSGGNGSGWKKGKLLGCVFVHLDLKAVEASVVNNKACVIQSGWFPVAGNGAGCGLQLHVNVKAEPDPRFVFHFDGEPECSPQVFQVNGNVRQPVFTCKFGFRSCGERNLRSSRSSLSEQNITRGCFGTKFTSNKEQQPMKERKGWSITIHDLSGSPVAAASMVTPFVASPGTDKVSKSNPGAWLILQPGHGTWKPWGKLEAWREQNGDLGYRFELIPDGSIDTITLASSTISSKNGGKFCIDIATGATPLTSPNSSFDFGSSGTGSGSGSGSEPGSTSGSGSWAHLLYRGFVMSTTVEGNGKCSKPEVEVGEQHVTCSEDAAAFVALAAALDLSMDACKSFSQKLRKELMEPDQE